MSQINTNGINTNYPVPGQNNSSQGFRDNFAQIKDKAGLVIVFMALFLAANTYIANGFSSTAQTNLLQASNTYGFYQSKSIKQTLAEGQLEEARKGTDTARIEKLEAKIAIAIRLAEVIDDCKDQEVLRGLRSLFHALIGDLVNSEVRH